MTERRVLYITPYPPEPSGIADYARDFERAIGAYCRVDILASGRGGQTSNSYRAVRDGIAEIDRRLRASTYDVIHVELGRSLLFGFYAGLYCGYRHPRIPLVLTLHDPPRLVWHPLMFAGVKRFPLVNVAWAGVSAPVEWLLERLLYRRAWRILLFSRRGGGMLQARMGPQHVTVIPMGVRSYPHRIASEKLRVGYYGYLYREKGVEVMIAAIAKLVGAQPRLTDAVSFTICGTVSQLSNVAAAWRYQQLLNAAIDREGLRSVITLASNLSSEDEARFLGSTDILVLPYLRSNTLATSSVLVKGLAAGCAVIASDVKSFSEMVDHGRNGLLVPPQHPTALACAIWSLAENRDEVLRLGQEAQKRSAAANSWPVVAGIMKGIYEEVVNEATTR